jgi:hypothetical protein
MIPAGRTAPAAPTAGFAAAGCYGSLGLTIRGGEHSQKHFHLWAVGCSAMQNGDKFTVSWHQWMDGCGHRLDLRVWLVRDDRHRRRDRL